MVHIKGFQKTSLIDYPGKMCSVVFLGGCNFRCPYCHNPDLILKQGEMPDIPEEEVFSHLEKRKDWIDGVCITGGEPCLNEDLPSFIRKIKSMGFLVKLDTNGSRPGMLEKLIKDGLLDYIAMDIKAPPEKYSDVAGTRVDPGDIKKSAKLIMGSGVDHEMRSTVLPRLHSREDIVRMAESVGDARVYFLQKSRAGSTLDPAFSDHKPFTSEELENIRGDCSRHVRTELRV